MKIKPGANYDDLTPRMKEACDVVEKEYEYEDYIAVLTSGKDGKHKDDSLHYTGNAGDYRTRHLRDDARDRIVARIRRALGRDFDVILETDHLHIEYDPKSPGV